MAVVINYASWTYEVSCTCINNPFEHFLNMDSIGFLSSTKFLKFQACKNEKTIASNLEKIKKKKSVRLWSSQELR